MLVCFVSMNWLFIAVSCFVCCCCFLIMLPRFFRENAPKIFFSILCSRPVPLEDFCTIMLLYNWWSFVHHSAYDSSRNWPLRKLENWLLLGTQIRSAAEQQLSAWMRYGYGNPGRFHFSWVYTFSVMLSSMRNCKPRQIPRLRTSTPAQLCWSSSRLQRLQKI